MAEWNGSPFSLASRVALVTGSAGGLGYEIGFALGRAGAKVYIQFPARLDQGEAPALFVIGRDGKSQLVNYRMSGDYYVVDRLFARDVDLGRPTTARLLAPAGHDEARLGKHVEVVAGDVGVQPERLSRVAGTHGFARGAQSLVDPGPRRHRKGALDGVVRLGVGGWSGHGQHGLFGRWARCTSFAVLARSAPQA